MSAVLALVPGLLYPHGIPAREEQFAAGIPIADTASLPGLALHHQGNSWQPLTLSISRGERVRLDLHNRDSIPHAFSLGTKMSLRDQATMHRLMPEQKTDYPNTRWLDPDQRASIGWEFNRSGEFLVRCLIPSHQATEAPAIILVQPEALRQAAE